MVSRGDFCDVTRTIRRAGRGDFDGVLRLWELSEDEVKSPHERQADD